LMQPGLRGSPNMQVVRTVGLDIAKSIFQVRDAKVSRNP
jgi:hypothetical protein